MTPTNLEELKRAAEAATPGGATLEDVIRCAPGSVEFKKLDAPATILSLISELEAVRERNEWRPIKSAPRDGSWVWLWNKHVKHPSDAPQRFRWSTHYSVFGLGGCWTDGLATMGDGIDFDFWCPALPANFYDPYAARAHFQSQEASDVR